MTKSVRKLDFSCVQFAVLLSLFVISDIFFSACTSASLEPSYVLRAIGADEDLAHSSIRYGPSYSY